MLRGHIQMVCHVCGGRERSRQYAKTDIWSQVTAQRLLGAKIQNKCHGNRESVLGEFPLSSFLPLCQNDNNAVWLNIAVRNVMNKE